MRKIALIALTSLPLFAGFFPQPIHTSITEVNKNSVRLAHPFQTNGMSGVVIHNYGNEIKAITSRIIQTDTTHTKIVHSDIIKHEKLPSIKTDAVIGDKVIGGYLYNNILLLAPNAKVYTNITSSAKKNWIHPDLFALFLEKKGEDTPTKSNLKQFAKKYQIGLIYIISKNHAKLLDPISGMIVGEKSIKNNNEETKAPFFMRFSEITTGLFSSKNNKSYYEIMDRF